MTADGHIKGSVDRTLLLQLMQGHQQYKHDIKRYTPHVPTTFFTTEANCTNAYASTYASTYADVGSSVEMLYSTLQTNSNAAARWQ